ncbi:hypothetical protein [Desulfosporosinus sp. OT]|uniref:hypothetical protein n=1 Tax=Desulfosporosinus sp. OT TaxID=913865 RepID=UPI0011129E71|nr:hypothetical protein [Desulfosporosinus sp. OT]
MSADDKALRNSTGLVQGWTDAAVPEDTVFARISLLQDGRSGAHAESSEVLSFSISDKRIAMERVRIRYSPVTIVSSGDYRRSRDP